MNCLEFRRTLLEDPGCKTPPFLEHAQQCPVCQREYDRAQGFEASLRDALRVEPPPDLAQRILDAQRARTPASPAPRGRKAWAVSGAIAATLALAVGIAMLRPGGSEPPADGLEANVLHHVQDELPHLHEVQEVSPQQLAKLIESLGGRLKQPLQQVNFAGKCQMRRYPGAHLVLVGRKGPVTVLIMPGERIASLRHFSSQRFEGELVPTDYGSLAVIGEKGEDTASIAATVSRDIAWSG